MLSKLWMWIFTFSWISGPTKIRSLILALIFERQNNFLIAEIAECLQEWVTGNSKRIFHSKKHTFLKYCKLVAEGSHLAIGHVLSYRLVHVNKPQCECVLSIQYKYYYHITINERLWNVLMFDRINIKISFFCPEKCIIYSIYTAYLAAYNYTTK